MVPPIAALSVSLDVDSPPNAAEAHSGSASMTLANARQTVLHRASLAEFDGISLLSGACAEIEILPVRLFSDTDYD